MIELIPAIDIIGGHCVRLRQGDYGSATDYGADPVAIARGFESIGYKRLHVVDLDGARGGHIVNTATLRALAESTDMEIDFGGGIKSDADIEAAFDCGASMVTVGSVAATDPEQTLAWAERFGAERIIIGADVRHGKIAIKGWTEDSGLDLVPFLRSYAEQGLTQVLCTDISRDGTLEGPSVELYRLLMRELPSVRLIASGGVASADDIRLLDSIGVHAVVFGKAIYEGLIDMEELWHSQNA